MPDRAESFRFMPKVMKKKSDQEVIIRAFRKMISSMEGLPMCFKKLPRLAAESRKGVKTKEKRGTLQRSNMEGTPACFAGRRGCRADSNHLTAAQKDSLGSYLLSINSHSFVDERLAIH